MSEVQHEGYSPIDGLPPLESDLLWIEDGFDDYGDADSSSSSDQPQDSSVEQKNDINVVYFEDLQEVLKARKSEEAFSQLLSKYRGLISGIASKYFLPGDNKDDLVQEARFGFYKAVRDYNGQSMFISFAELCVRRQVIAAVKGATRLKHRALNTADSIELPYDHNGEGEAVVLGETLASTSPSVEEVVISKEELEKLVFIIGSTFSQLEADVLRLFLDGKSYAEIAEELGVSPKKVDNARARGKRKIIDFEETGFIPIQYNDQVSTIPLKAIRKKPGAAAKIEDAKESSSEEELLEMTNAREKANHNGTAQKAGSISLGGASAEAPTG